MFVKKKFMEMTTVNSDHLLEGSLDWLHQQTTEWCSEVEFWREELVFFYRLLRKRELKANLPSQRLADLEKELVKISSEDLQELRTLLRKHDAKLRKLTEQISKNSELEYRHNHKAILFNIQHFEIKMRNFKKSVFGFVKQ
jgi:hypothetical protein